MELGGAIRPQRGTITRVRVLLILFGEHGTLHAEQDDTRDSEETPGKFTCLKSYHVTPLDCYDLMT
jgi:hypothetical protein